jgi:hypothetical protein
MPADQIVGDTDVESTAATACKNLNPKPHLLLNNRGFARVRGLDTGMNPQSVRFIKTLLSKKMDARVKPAHDEFAMQLKVVIAGLDPAIHPSS